jgi:hypothetical protein
MLASPIRGSLAATEERLSFATTVSDLAGGAAESADLFSSCGLAAPPAPPAASSRSSPCLRLRWSQCARGRALVGLAPLNQPLARCRSETATAWRCSLNSTPVLAIADRIRARGCAVRSTASSHFDE